MRLKPKKVQTQSGFEPMTSAVPVQTVQCSTNWAIMQAIWELVILRARNTSRRRWRMQMNIWKITFELRRKIWRHNWSQLYTQLTEAVVKLKPEKNSRSERDSTPWPLRCRCSSLPTEFRPEIVSGFNFTTAVVSITALINQYLSSQLKYMIFHILMCKD